MTSTRLIQSGFCDAATNMAIDEALFISYEENTSAPILRLYGWNPASISIGYSQKPEEVLNLDACKKENISIVRRPTGGGVIFHDDEITYSLILSESDIGLSNSVKQSFEKITAFLILAYQAFNGHVSFAKDLHKRISHPADIAEFCFSRKEDYDILVDGKKLGGNAQKRRKKIILQHGSIPLSFDKNKAGRFLKDPGVLESLDITSIRQIARQNIDFKTMQEILIQAFCFHFNTTIKKDDLTQEEHRLAEKLKISKYTSDLRPRPEWLKKKIEFDSGRTTSILLSELKLNTVCKEARCPNISECFKKHQASFLILGRHCSRHCCFCSVEKLEPEPVDSGEPERVALAVKKLGLKYIVITSVTRDDLADGGAGLFIKTVQEIKKLSPAPSIELLIPDFKGDPQIIAKVAQSRPEILGHNIETVPRLYSLRPEADYQRSIRVLKSIKEANPDISTKSALMVGLGEKKDEVAGVMEDLRNVCCDFLALGQYLRPSIKHAEVVEYITPEEFDEYKSLALSLGFKHVESSPYVRSSYRAAEYLNKA